MAAHVVSRPPRSGGAGHGRSYEWEVQDAAAQGMTRPRRAPRLSETTLFLASFFETPKFRP